MGRETRIIETKKKLPICPPSTVSSSLLYLSCPHQFLPFIFLSCVNLNLRSSSMNVFVTYFSIIALYRKVIHAKHRLSIWHLIKFIRFYLNVFFLYKVIAVILLDSSIFLCLSDFLSDYLFVIIYHYCLYSFCLFVCIAIYLSVHCFAPMDSLFWLFWY